MKRICTMLLAVVMLLGTLTMLPVSAATVTEGDYEYEVSNGEATITKYAGKDKDVTIPSTLGGYPVIAIGNAAFWGLGLSSVVIPDGVTTIGAQAFYYCDYLETIEIPNSVTMIGAGAFEACRNMTSIEIPNSVTTIGVGAFEWCDALTAIELPDGLLEIGAGMFRDCTSLEHVTIGNAVTTIGGSAFAFCKSLTSIEIPATVETMGPRVFDACEGLTDIYCLSPEQPSGWNSEWLGSCNATVHWENTTEPEPSTPSLGDLGGNGKIDSNDYMLLKRYCLNTLNLTAEQLAVADINKDGKINATDYMLLKRVVLGTYTLK